MFGQGGMGGMGGMPNLPPGLMSDPEFMQLMSDPATQQLMPVLMQAQQNPSIMQQHMNNPIVQRMMRILQRHGMGGGMGGGMGNGWGSSTASKPPESSDYTTISSSVQLEPFLAIQNVPVVIYFSMQGCGPCANIKPIWDSLCSAHKGKMNFLKVMRTSTGITQKYNITSYPQFIIFFNRQEVERLRGGNCGPMLDAKIKKWIATAQSMSAPKARFVHFPVNPSKLPSFPKAPPKAGILSSKLLQKNQTLVGTPHHLDDAEVSNVLRLCGKLDVSGLPQTYTGAELALAAKLLTWEPQDVLFSIEVFRLLVRDQAVATHFAKEQETMKRLLSFCANETGNVQFFALKAAVNACRHSAILDSYEDLADLLDMLAPCRGVTEGKTAGKVRKAFVNIMTIVANYFRTTQRDVSETKVQMLSTLNEVLLEEKSGDVLYSSLVCLGTLLLGDAEAVEFTQMFELESVLATVQAQRAGSTKYDEGIRQACGELRKLLEDPDGEEDLKGQEEDNDSDDIYS